MNPGNYFLLTQFPKVINALLPPWLHDVVPGTNPTVRIPHRTLCEERLFFPLEDRKICSKPGFDRYRRLLWDTMSSSLDASKKPPFFQKPALSSFFFFARKVWFFSSESIRFALRASSGCASSKTSKVWQRAGVVPLFTPSLSSDYSTTILSSFRRL